MDQSYGDQMQIIKIQNIYININIQNTINKESTATQGRASLDELTEFHKMEGHSSAELTKA